MNENYPDANDKKLIQAFALLKNEKEIQNFLRDLLTLPEIKEASKRFYIASLLWNKNLTYKQIASRAKTSTATVTRVADWQFKKGLNGYQIILQRLNPEQSQRA